MSIGTLLIIVVFLLVMLFMSHVFLTKTVSTGDVLIKRKNKEVIEILKEIKHFWIWELKEYDIFLPFTPSAAMETHPITANPKVRQMKYRISTKVSDSIASMQLFYSFQKEKKGWWEQSKFLKRMLFNFNEEHSKDLAELFNPLEPTQQEKFTALVKGYLNPKLALVGLEVKETEFSLN